MSIEEMKVTEELNTSEETKVLEETVSDTDVFGENVAPEVTVSEEDEKKNRFRFQWSRFNKLGFSLVFFTMFSASMPSL